MLGITERIQTFPFVMNVRLWTGFPVSLLEFSDFKTSRPREKPNMKSENFAFVESPRGKIIIFMKRDDSSAL